MIAFMDYQSVFILVLIFTNLFIGRVYTEQTPRQECTIGESFHLLNFNDWSLKDPECLTRYNVSLTLTPATPLLTCSANGHVKRCSGSYQDNVSLSFPVGFRLPCDKTFAGTYESTVDCGEGIQTFNTTLVVIDYPTIPEIYEKSTNNETLKRFRCHGESTSYPPIMRNGIVYTWLVDGRGLDESDHVTVSGDSGEILDVDADIDNVTCIVREEGSKLSRRTEFVIAKPGNVVTSSESTKAVTSQPSQGQQDDRTGLYITAGVCGALALLSLCVVILMLRTRNRKVKRNTNTTTITFRNNSAESTPFSSPGNTRDRRVWNHSMTSPVSTMTSRNTYLDIDAAMEAFPEIADSESVRLLCDSTDSFRGPEPLLCNNPTTGNDARCINPDVYAHVSKGPPLDVNPALHGGGNDLKPTFSSFKSPKQDGTILVENNMYKPMETHLL